MADGLSPVHRIIETFSNAVTALGLDVPPLFVERWAVSVHQALSSRAREFHTHQHVLDLVRGADAIETIAALYHDIVYVQVDLDVPTHYAQLLSPLLESDQSTQHGWKLLPHAGVDPTARDVLALFGRRPGEVLTPFTGLNELASGLVAAKELEGILSRTQNLAVMACIEASIPFRAHGQMHLESRLAALGVSPEDIGVMVRRATRLSNNDVGNFADPDPARFLDNTWKLLPETNPSLHTPTTYSIRDYRVALMKMEHFLGQLPAEKVFHAWGGEPSTETHRALVEAAARNIGIAVRYMRCKLYATSLVEALANESGGDAPLPYLIGGVQEVGGQKMRRIEDFFPAPVEQDGARRDPLLLRLLRFGRATPSFFDISPSPIAEYLYVSMGEDRMLEGAEQARRMWDHSVTGRQFLQQQPRAEVLAIARATAQMAPTRSAAIEALVGKL